ncbi:MAG: GxxExxY protein [Candidatus Brocadiaceae bacterium]|nr:GxxExxY protein [Candidatus Brocadiaceae bacterium]
MYLNQVTEKIIGAAIEIHKTLGRDSWNQRMKSVYVMNYPGQDCIFRGKSICRFCIKRYVLIMANNL